MAPRAISPVEEGDVELFVPVLRNTKRGLRHRRAELQSGLRDSWRALDLLAYFGGWI
jgi:hypothetical protein